MATNAEHDNYHQVLRAYFKRQFSADSAKLILSTGFGITAGIVCGFAVGTPVGAAIVAGMMTMLAVGVGSYYALKWLADRPLRRSAQRIDREGRRIDPSGSIMGTRGAPINPAYGD